MNGANNSAKVLQVERLFVLDFDRCLGGDRLYSLLEEVVASLPNMDHDGLREARARTEASGGSFDMLSWLKESVNERVWGGVSKAISVAYLRRAAERDIEEFRGVGATELLTHLEVHRVPYVILTYGGEEYQGLKIAAAGYSDTPRIVTTTKQKGKLIAAWWHEGEGVFRTPAFHTGVKYESRSIVLVDDKREAFDDLSLQAEGYWVSGRREEGLPQGVRICETLRGVIEYESHSIDI